MLISRGFDKNVWKEGTKEGESINGTTCNRVLPTTMSSAAKYCVIGSILEADGSSAAKMQRIVPEKVTYSAAKIQPTISIS
jgi:hypothetical protein